MNEIIYVLCISCCFNSYVISDVNPSKSKYSNYVRCTRRYSPGMCVEPVIAVWTFVFEQQNCTQRLGCPVDWRGNRFGNYESCMHRCIPLVDLYMEILTQNQNASYLRIRKWDSSSKLKIDGKLDLEEEDYEVLLTRVTVDGPAPNPMDDDDDTKFEDTPDIDYYNNEDRKKDLDDDLI